MTRARRQRSQPHLAPAAVLALACALPSHARAAEIVLSERSPAVLLVVTPAHTIPPVPESVLLDGADAALRAKTGLFVQSIEQAGIDRKALDACSPERLWTCWVSAVRGRAREAASRPRPRFLIVVVAHAAAGERAQLLGVLIDLDAAVEIQDRAPRDATDRDEHVESELFSSAVRGELREVGVEAVPAFFESLLDGAFRAPIEARGLWEPFGAIEIEVATGGPYLLELDGTPLGPCQSGLTTVRDVPAGAHAIVLRGPDGEIVGRDAEVERGAVARIALEPELPGRALRTGLFWSGLATAAAGAAVTGVAIARGTDGLRVGCVSRPGAGEEACRGLGSVTPGYDPTLAPSLDPAAVNPSGVPLAPLGAALIAAGATWAAGAALFDEGAPWLELGAGVLAGALTFAAGAALDPR